MSIKRIYKDPAGVTPDTVAIELDGAPTDFADIAKLLKSNAPAARIDRLRRHDSMRTTADLLTESLQAATTDAGRMVVLIDISNAEQRALHLDVAPRVIRDAERQKGAKKDRRGRMPLLEAWLDEQDLNITDDKLHQKLPTSSEIDDDEDEALYRDTDESVTEKHLDGPNRTITRTIKRSAFDKRVTKARKRRK
jgi:hypothetical protein